MDIETIIRESQAEKLVGPLGFTTDIGKQEFSRHLRFFTSNPDAILRRQEAIHSLRKDLTSEIENNLETVFQTVSSLEPELKIFTGKSDVEKNSYDQLTFSQWAWSQILNTFPFVLLLLSYFKLYVVPIMALFTPVFLVVMPYLILVYGYKLPISLNQYKDLMMGMMGIQMETLWTPRGMIQTGLTLVSVGQSMIQPVQNALHLQTINKDLVKRGQAVEHLANQLDILTRHLSIKNPLQELVARADPHRSFGETWDLPFRMKLALTAVGEAEVVYRIAKSTMNLVFFRNTGGFHLKNARDPLIGNSIPFSVSFSQREKHHAILTGPNRGGKSSFLRATLLNIVLAQTFGYNYTEKCTLKPIDWIATGLRLEDRPGKSSMFEREVEFAVEILKRARQNPRQTGLVLFDELFHSTNPPDGTRTASLFLQQVWKQSNLISIISTHVFSLAKGAPEIVRKLCVPAEINEMGNLVFSYSLRDGICEVSSVDCILKEKGLLTAEFKAPENRNAKER